MLFLTPSHLEVFAFTDNSSTYNQLSLTGGMQPTKLSSIKNQANTIKNVKTILIKKYKMKKGNKFILLAGIFSASHSDSLQIIKI